MCNATLTTATVVECEYEGDHYHDNCWISDGKWVHTELHVLECEDHNPNGDIAESHTSAGLTVWWDDYTPGAKPHQKPLVSEEAFMAAKELLYPAVPEHRIRRALRAAAKAD